MNSEGAVLIYTLVRVGCFIFLFPITCPSFLGIPIRTTLDNSTTVQYAGLIHQLTAKARSTVRDIDPGV